MLIPIQYLNILYKVIFISVFDRHLPVTKEECQKKLKEEFLKNKHITDVRVIDMLVIKVHIN